MVAIEETRTANKLTFMKCMDEVLQVSDEGSCGRHPILFRKMLQEIIQHCIEARRIIDEQRVTRVVE